MADKFTYTLHELVAAVDAYADEHLQAEYDISLSKFEFLAVAVEVHPADITQMASCLGVTKAAVSKRVPALVAGGWLERNSDPANARRVVISPTAAAIELVELAAADLERLFADLFTDPRVDPAVTRGAVPLKKLNAHLSALTNILHEKGYGV